jgi:hypothetical protein
MHIGAYTGIGSRKTPQDVMDTFSGLAAQLEAQGWKLRSGGADGADSAFDAGVQSAANKEIFVPWTGFNQVNGLRPAQALWLEAAAIVADVHPAWKRLKPAERSLHTRNAFQVLGADLRSPSVFVVCWTSDGAEAEEQTSKETGGTRTAIVIASRSAIPIVNFGRPNALDRLSAVLQAGAPQGSQ